MHNMQTIKLKQTHNHYQTAEHQRKREQPQREETHDTQTAYFLWENIKAKRQ